MFRKIDYGTDQKFEPISVLRVHYENKKYHEYEVIIGKSVLKKEIKKYSENRTILELMKGMNKS